MKPLLTQNLKITTLSLTLLMAINAFSGESTKPSSVISNFCKKIDLSFKKYNWDKSDCEKYEWTHVRNSVLGDPLVWSVFGDASEENKANFKQKDVSIIMCGVHGDEITPIKFCFDILSYLKEVYSDEEKVKKEFKDKIVIVAPLVNPDSFFKAKPTRINAHGIDVNRNFGTKDWSIDARRLWLAKFKKDKRRNPGISPNSEPEVVFQINLIKRYGPDKIISVHSPLTMLDYDGPNAIVDGFVDGAKAHELLIQMSKDASDYKIVNYPFFPGSLGNWAGKERDIPTYTLELPTSDPSKSDEYWKLFKSAIHNAISHDLKEKNEQKTVDKKDPSSDGNPSNPTQVNTENKSLDVVAVKKESLN